MQLHGLISYHVTLSSGESLFRLHWVPADKFLDGV